MADPMTLAVGGGILAAGWLMGRASRRPKTPKPPRPICTCDHGYGMHEPDGGRCHGLKQTWSQALGQHQVPCTCQTYDGPEPLPRSWVPELPGLAPPKLEDKRDA